MFKMPAYDAFGIAFIGFGIMVAVALAMLFDVDAAIRSPQ